MAADAQPRETAESAHDAGGHVSRDRQDRAFWARTCSYCARVYDPETGLPLRPDLSRVFRDV